jgi:hypothetical protein
MDTPISKYPSVDALMRPKMLDRGAKGGVHDGLNNDQPRCARGPVQAARPREALANVGTFASHASQGGPLSLLRSRGQLERQRASPASSNPPVSAALVLPPSYLVSACSSWLQTEAANDSELSSHECSLIRGLIFDLQDLTCQPSRHTNSLYGARIQTYRDSSAPAARICDSLGG